MASVNEIISKKAVDDILAANKAIQDTNNSLNNLIKTIESQNQSLNTNKVSIDSVNKSRINSQNSQKKLDDLTKESIAIDNKLESAKKSLENQRQRGLAAMAKQEQKEKDLQAAINKEVKSEQDLINKTNALIIVRKRLDTSTESGIAEHKRLTSEINRNTAALKNQDANIGRFQRNVGNYKESLNSIKTGYIVAAAAIAGAIRAVKGWIDAADVQQKAEAKLLTALKGRVDVQQRLMAQASQLQGVTLFGDEETINAQSYLAAMGLNEGAIKRLIPLVQDLATKNGTDLKTSADLIAKSVGSSTNALSRYGITLTGAVGSSERLESAIDGLNNQVGGQSVAAANAGAGAVKQFSNAWGDLKEQLGAKLLPTINILFKNLTLALKSASKIREEVFFGQLAEQEKLDIDEFKQYNKLLKERGVDTSNLTAISQRFLKVDQDRLLILKEDENANEKQIAILETRIRAISEYTDTQVNGLNLVLEKQNEETEATKKQTESMWEQFYAEEEIEAERERLKGIKSDEDIIVDAEAEMDAEHELILEKTEEFLDNKAALEEAAFLRKQELTNKEIELERLKQTFLYTGLTALAGIFGKQSLLQKAFFLKEKAIAISSILINLQKEKAAIAAAYAGIPFAGIAIIATLQAKAQLRAILGIGIIAAQAVAGFKKGTKGKSNTPDTFVTSEDSKTEWIEKAGKIIQTDKPTVFSGMQGSRVYSNPEVMTLSKGKGNFDAVKFDLLRGDIVSGNKMIAKEIRRKPTLVTDVNGKITGVQIGGNRKRYIDEMMGYGNN